MKRFSLSTRMTCMVGHEIDLERFLICSSAGYFPVAAAAPGGGIAVVARWADIHIGQLGSLAVTESDDGGTSWSRLRPLDFEGTDVRNPAFGITSRGTWVLAYIEMDCYPQGRWKPDGMGVFPIRITRSSDSGRTWSDPVVIDPRPRSLCSPYGRIAEDRYGSLLLSIYGDNEVFLCRSSDDGCTWDEPHPVAAGFNETAVLPLPDGRVLAFLRSAESGEDAGTWLGESADGGRSWSAPRRLLGAARHPADAVRLADGTLVLAYGHRNPPFGVRVVASRDGGRTWDTGRTLVLTADCSTWDCGYPSSVVLPDGRILTAYYALDAMGSLRNGERYPLGLHAGAIRWDPRVLEG
jgi:hypothetical protein